MSNTPCLDDLQAYLDSILPITNKTNASTINIEITNYPNLEALQNVSEVSNLNEPQVSNLGNISSETETDAAVISTLLGRLDKPKKSIFSKLKNFLTRRKGGGRTNISTSMTNYNNITKKKPYVSTIIHNKPKKNKIPIIPTKKKHVYPYTKLSNKLKK